MDGEQDPTLPEWVQSMAVAEPPPRREAVREVAASDPPVVTWQELAAVGSIVLLADITLFRGHGYTGCALFFLLAPALLLAGMTSRRHSIGAWISGAMLVLLAAKLLWCGSVLLVFFGFALTVAIAMSALGHPPFVLELIVYASQTIQAGYVGLVLQRPPDQLRRGRLTSPLATVLGRHHSRGNRRDAGQTRATCGGHGKQAAA